MALKTSSGEFEQGSSLRHWLNESKRAAATGESQSISVHDLELAWRPRFDSAEIEELVIPRRTMARRKSLDAILNQEETDRAFRLAQIQMEADRVFGDPEKASRWLRSQNVKLTGQTPLSVLRSAAGAALVTEMLVQIDYGMFA